MYVNIFKSFWVQVPWWSVRKVSRILFLAFLGAILIGLILFALYMKSLPPLSLWHTTILQNEYTTKSDIKGFEGYMALEKRLFEELDNKIYNKIPKSEKNQINRYTRGSVSDPKRWQERYNISYNKSFELPAENAKMGILLIHGMSDSPYSLHTQAEYLNEKGVWIVALRLPGHGTIPSGLVEVTWQDMAAVVKMGMARLKEKVGDKPIYMMGYSTGASLALHYTFKSLEDNTLTLPSGLIFYSPAIGISPAAPFAVWQSRLGHLLGLSKLEWNTIAPEFDPFKYGSFAVNAGDQVYRICNEVQHQFDTYRQHPKSTKSFPPVLSFASIVDSTVSVSATINQLYKRLPEGEHTLVLFDISHTFSANHFVKQSTTDSLSQLRKTAPGDHYTFELITDLNTTEGNLTRIIDGKTVEKLPFSWPKNLYSLSHISLPISSNDPLYGDKHAPKSPGIQLGHLAIYGENGILQISPASLLRLRWNPFHQYTKQRVLKFLKLEEH
jgi:pimeloyl-ACP methyl ester carboxylesterase